MSSVCFPTRETQEEDGHLGSRRVLAPHLLGHHLDLRLPAPRTMRVSGMEGLAGGIFLPSTWIRQQDLLGEQECKIWPRRVTKTKMRGAGDSTSLSPLCWERRTTCSIALSL